MDLLPIYGISMKEIMVNHWMLGYHLATRTWWSNKMRSVLKFCCQKNAKAHSGEKNGTWLQGPFFLLDVYMLFPNSQTLTSQQKTSPAADASWRRPSGTAVRQCGILCIHLHKPWLKRWSEMTLKIEGPKINVIWFYIHPFYPHSNGQVWRNPIFCGTLEEKSPESAFRACSHRAKLLFKAASICCHLWVDHPFPHHNPPPKRPFGEYIHHFQTHPYHSTFRYKVTKCPEWYSQSILLAETKIWQTRGVQDSRTLQKALGLWFSALLQSPDLLEQPIISSSDCGQKLLLRSWWIRVWSNWPTAILDGFKSLPLLVISVVCV